MDGSKLDLKVERTGLSAVSERTLIPRSGGRPVIEEKFYANRMENGMDLTKWKT